MATVLAPAPASIPPRAPLPDRPTAGERIEWAVPWLIAAAALGIGAMLYHAFWQESRGLWYWIVHDRSAHLDFGINLAMDVRHGNVRGLLHHLDGARVWGPLHGILVGLVQLVAGPDYRLGIVPSWCAWIATVVLGYLVARRLTPRGGMAAGILAALLIVQSPAHRAYATEIMLESLGAALTLLCCLRYLIAVQDDAPTRGRWLGLSLTALFLTKSNYWVLIAVGLMAGECLRQPRLVGAAALALKDAVCSRRWLRAQACNPWNYLVLALIGMAAGIVATGGFTTTIAGTALSLTRGHNLVHFAYLIIFVRAGLWWRRNAIGPKLQGRPVLRDLLCWHVWPVACYFLLPKRLGYFLWYLSPANSVVDGSTVNLFGGIAYYFGALERDFHLHTWMPYAVVAGAALGLVALFRGRPGAASIGCFLALAAFVTCRHPMWKERFAHTWVPALWIVAAAGVVIGLDVLLRRVPRARVACAAGLCAALAALVLPGALQPGRAREGGVRPGITSVLTITDAYLPALGEARRPTLLCNVFSPFLLSWTFQERHGHQNFATEIKGYTPEDANLAAVEAWADKNHSDVLVLIDVAKDSPLFEESGTNYDLAPLERWLVNPVHGFACRQEWRLPERVTITLWARRGSAARSFSASQFAQD